jgi:hypothetical protein
LARIKEGIMTTKKKTSVPPDKLLLYEKLVAGVEGAELWSNPATATLRP